MATPKDPVSTVLNFGADLGNRANTPIEQSLREASDVANWVHLATVIYAASCLEMYVRRIINLALQSDPGLLIGKSKAVDGVSLLKAGTSLDTSERIQACTHGEWDKRQRAIIKIFGVPIPELTASVGELHFLQKLRNSVAHDFARTARKKDFWYLDPEQASPQPFERVSANRVQKLLRTVSLVADELDTVAKPHIGSFELLLFWHQFERERASPKTKVIERYVKLYKEGSYSKLLSTFHHLLIGGVLEREYCDKLVRYYNSC
jgi:hypothetical protein